MKEDYQNVCFAVKFASDQLKKIDTDVRLKEVSKDGLTFAPENPEEITLMNSKTRQSYKGSYPKYGCFCKLTPGCSQILQVVRNIAPYKSFRDKF